MTTHDTPAQPFPPAALPKRYDPAAMEPAIQAYWREQHVYDFDPASEAPVYSIDTPPATVSGHLHLGHVYSYSQTDFIARFRRMRGANVYYPMGFDDNGLPTERLVEKRQGVTARQIGRSAFIVRCLETADEAEGDYRALWQRLGLSVDWRYTYRTIDDDARRISQLSFVRLARAGRAYRAEAPAIWCPECQTAIAQAELNDLERETTFYTLAFALEDGTPLPIATTRPELLPACVAIFVHPDDARYADRIGQQATTPLGDAVPLLADAGADPAKGTGAVMCCTFGDAADVEWWRVYKLPLQAILGRDGRLTEAAGAYAGMTIAEARQAIIAALEAQGKVLVRQTIPQSVRVHERCDTPVEYLVTWQWFIRVLDQKERLLAAGERVAWHPAAMAARYRDWVEHLAWDWCISRQRYFGVPFPVWYCDACGEAVLAEEGALPVDPTESQPPRACACGGTTFTPERDVMDTWATSSMTPQIAGHWLSEPDLYTRVFPYSLRPQAHEIIRTWAFDTLVKSLEHFDALPWSDVAISGWGIAAEGAGKISKRTGGGSFAPNEIIARYSADAARYWAASTGLGKDSVIREEKIAEGQKLATKLWNVAKFAERFLRGHAPPAAAPLLSPADRWLLARIQRLLARATELLEGYDYAAAKAEMEAFFWRDLADNYLEMAKARLYDDAHEQHDGARYTLHVALLSVVKLFAPFLPHVTEAIYQGVFAAGEGGGSLHRARWPQADAALLNEGAEAMGEALVDVATAVRRYKSEASLALGAELPLLQLATADAALAEALRAAAADLRSVTRARAFAVVERLDDDLAVLPAEGAVRVAVAQPRRADDQVPSGLRRQGTTAFGRDHPRPTP
jgi:valyl-tRNA synthetase